MAKTTVSKRGNHTPQKSQKSKKTPSKSYSSIPSQHYRSGDFLSKLKRLREFVSGSVNVTLTEKDLSKCLRECGYNVQIAAERLITGQYIPVDDDSNNKAKVSPFFAINGKRKKDTAVPMSAPKVVKRRKLMAEDEFLSGERDECHSKRVPTGTSIEIDDADSHNNNSIDLGGSGSNIERMSQKLLLCQRWIVAFSTSRRGSIRYKEPLQLSTATANINNASSTSKGINIVRFKAHRAEGTLDTNLSIILSPLLRYKTTSHNEEKNIPLIALKAEALMEDHHLQIGTEVPLQLSIYIIQPHLFFGLFENETNGTNTTTDNASFFKSTTNGNNITTVKRGKKSLTQAAFALLQWAQYGETPIHTSSTKLTYDESDEKDDKQKTPPTAVKGSNDNSCDANENDSNDSADANSGEIHHDDHSTEAIEDVEVQEEEEEEREQNQPQWAQDILARSNADSIHLPTINTTSSTIKTTSTVINKPIEAKDPKMLTQKGIQLKSYQRQALHWMMYREQDACNKHADTFKKELQLLSELAATTASGVDRTRDNVSGNVSIIDTNILEDENISGMNDVNKCSCEIGPVRVSNCVAKTCTTLNGAVDPVAHPLWRRRFLWDVTASAGDIIDAEGNINTCSAKIPSHKEEGFPQQPVVYSFYVNELLQIASKDAPNPPKQCIGGILADAMGLGKTVMLLSLIAKVKETEQEDVEENEFDSTVGKEGVAESTAIREKYVENEKELNDSETSVGTEIESSFGAASSLSFSAAQSSSSFSIKLPDPISSIDVSDDTKNDNDYYEDENDDNKKGNKALQSLKMSNTIGMDDKIDCIRSKTCEMNEGSTTLVVTPLSLLAQWEEEIETKTSLSYRVYYMDTAKKLSDNFDGVDVILTTYGTMQSEYLSSSSSEGKKNTRKSCLNSLNSSALLSYKWKRVILDEAHCIRNPQTAASKACCALLAQRRWCVTGTPIQNSLQDVYGLLKFLRHEPWCDAGFWKTAITNAATNTVETGETFKVKGRDEVKSTDISYSGIKIALDRVRRVLNPLILRRTKDTLAADGKPILILPPVESKVISVTLTETEREFYNALLDKSQTVFDGFVRSGTATKSWFAIFSLLQRLRQACDHVALTVKSHLTLAEFIDKDSDSQEKIYKGMIGKENISLSLKLSEADHNAVNDKFLDGLLAMFCNKQRGKSSNLDQVDAQSKGVEAPAQSYVNTFAHSLTQCVRSSDKIESECPICLETPKIEEAIFTPCAHAFCRACLVSILNGNANKKNVKSGQTQIKRIFTIGKSTFSCKNGECPVCQTWIDTSRMVLISRSNETGKATTIQMSKYMETDPTKEEVSLKSKHRVHTARETLDAALTGKPSAKLTAILDELDAVWLTDPGSNILIFSQFLGFLDLLQQPLEQRGICHYRLDGKMKLKDRIKVLEQFSSRDNIESVGSKKYDKGNVKRGSVFLASMKAGGVGINLVAASSVFIVDPWWNAAVEDQCVNRIHRIGQMAKVVRVRKFVVTDSVEEKIVKLQHKKKGMASEILSDVGDGSAKISDSKPTLDDFKMVFSR